MTLAAENLPPETAAEYLRMALPLMSQHGVPATPQNYAVWYGYVSGEKPELKAAIDRHLGAREKFTPAVCEQLYREYIAEHDIAEVEKVRKDLSQILIEVVASLNEAGHEANAFGDRIGGLVDQADREAELKDIRNLLSALIEETRGMRAATDQMHSNFENKSKEIEELQQQLQRERQRAITDPLTGLFNRAALVDQLNDAIDDEATGDSVPPALIMIDIDHFKSINDTHGHLIGDRVIRFVAQVLQKNIKGKDCAARYGGEEFTVLLPETPTKGAVAVAETIRNAIAQAQLVRADNKAPLGQITVSAGVASYQAGEDIMDFLNRADEAMYKSKNDGRNRVSAL